MRAPQQLSMEELEAIGEKHVRQQNKQTKNILASVRLVMACGWMIIIIIIIIQIVLYCILLTENEDNYILQSKIV